MYSPDQKFGMFWERVVLEKLHEAGYNQAKLIANFLADVDIMLGNLPIEVKAANPKSHLSGRHRSRCQFDVSRLPKGVDSVVVLVAVCEQPYFFVVPSWVLFGRYNIHITSHPTVYRGQFAQYLGNWGVIEAGLAIRQMFAGQMTLFQEMEVS